MQARRNFTNDAGISSVSLTMEQYWSEVRQALRALTRQPGFTAVAVLTLGLGIGANTAIFSIVNGVLLRPLVYREPDRLVTIREVLPKISHLYPSIPVSPRHLVEWQRHISSFKGMAATRPITLNLTGRGTPEQIDAALVSANLFSVLGVTPRLGRTFAEGDDHAGQDRVAILSDSLWRRRFQADSNLVGKTITLDGAAHIVVGVLPPSFRFPRPNLLAVGSSAAGRTEIFKPLAFSEQELRNLMGNFNYAVIARLKPDATREKAVAELNVVEASLAAQVPEKIELRVNVSPLRETVVGGVGRALLVLLGAVGAVLLIVCVNLANLLLARAEHRHRESAIRAALGAGVGRLVRQMLTETALIGALGGVVGIALAAGGLTLLVKSAPIDLPRLDEVQLDGRVLAFAAAISLATGLLFGILPAWRMARTDPQQALRAGSRSATQGTSSARLRNILVAAEVGLSTVLLITAGLLMSSFARMLRVDRGFDAASVVTTAVQLPSTKYKDPEQRARFYERANEALASQAGVLSAALVSALPLQGESWVDMVAPEGDTRPAFEQPTTNVRFVSADYFRAMGVPFRRGRSYQPGDHTRKVMVISERVAEKLWPGQEVLGRRLVWDGEPHEVIGVVGDVRSDLLKQPAPIIYPPYWERGLNKMNLIARAAGDPRSIATAVRAAVWSVDPEIPVPEISTMGQVADASVAQRRFQTMLSAAFAMAALLLASLGIYGVVSYSVARRTSEVGIRMALGAGAADLYGLILRQGMLPVWIGLVVGVGAALAAGRLLNSMLFEVSARDPLTIGTVTALLAMVAAAACWVPARRATRVDPMVALRCD